MAPGAGRRGAAGGGAGRAALLPGAAVVLLFVIAKPGVHVAWSSPAAPRRGRGGRAGAGARGAALRAWGPGSYLLFGIGGFQKEEFMLNTISGWLAGVPKGIACLEWQPDGQRVIRQIYGLGDRFLGRYTVAGNGFDPQFRDNFGMIGPFDRASVDFVQWPREGGLNVADDTVDLVVCTDEAADSLGDDSLEEAMRETARVLRPNGQLMLFQRPGRELPLGATELFATQDVASLPGDSEEGLEAVRLIPRATETQVPRRARRRRRRKPTEASG